MEKNYSVREARYSVMILHWKWGLANRITFMNNEYLSKNAVFSRNYVNILNRKLARDSLNLLFEAGLVQEKQIGRRKFHQFQLKIGNLFITINFLGN